MKVDAFIPPAQTGTPPLQADFGGRDSSEHLAESFAELLAAMLSGYRMSEGPKVDSAKSGPLVPDTDARAPELSPEIGTRGKAFEHAQLLVRTALEFPHLESRPREPRAVDLAQAEPRPLTKRPRESGPAPDQLTSPPLTPDRTFSITPIAAQSTENAVEPPQVVEPAVRLPRTVALPMKNAVELPPQVTESAARTRLVRTAGQLTENGVRRPSQVVEPAASIRLPRATTRTPTAPISTLPVAGPIEAEAPGPVAETSSARESSNPPVPRGSSPFGAQLVTIDGGLRLMLRVPRLAEGERATLEASLARLLESFGHRHHEIVIHEIAEGQL